MYLLRILQITTGWFLHSWLYQDTDCLRDNAFSHIAKVNLQYGMYQDGGRFYQIDMKLPNDYHKKKRVARAATSDESRLWPKGIVPYVIADSITKREEHFKILQGAMEEWQKKTCLKFKKRTTERDFVEFYYGEGCNSDVGVMGTGRQTTSLGKGCEDHGIMVHEIGHLIGLYHEQNRPDRDNYVEVLLENVFPRYHYAFEKKDEKETDNRGVPYDFYSVMHYGSKDFSKNKKPTIVSKADGITEFGNTKISNLDAKVVNLMYKCPELIKFPRDFQWKPYGINRRDKDCIRIKEPEDPYSWSNNYICRQPGKRHIGLEWSNSGPIEGMNCAKADAPSMEGKFGWDNNYFCWPKESVYKFTWEKKIPDRSVKHHCLKIYEPRDRYWSRRNYYLCGKQDESPVDGGWSVWSKWTECTRKCGGGYRRRVRTCNNPRPSYGGKYCMGEAAMTGRCGMKSCEEWPLFPDDFVYKVFQLPPIDLSCIRTYERFDYFQWANHLFCVRDDKKDPRFEWSDSGPKPGLKCVRIFNPVETKIRRNTWNNNYLCSPQDTPYNFQFSRKGAIKGMACLRWFPKENRGWDNSYLCSDFTGGTDKEVIKEDKPTHGGWSDWGPWTQCSRSCSGGVQKRFRTCTNPKPQNGGEQCSGAEKEETVCNSQRCAIDGQWTDWYPWSRCTNSCGGGEQQRRRTCTNPVPQNGGKQCEGVDIIRRRCNELPCAIDGGWSPWTWWGRCSKTCGQGIQVRSRSCTNPRPRDGGRMCPGKHAEIRECNSRQCPIDGAWSQWSSWSACSKTCSGGIQIRKRTCSNPNPQFGGRRCLGESKEEQRCNTTPCPIDGNWATWTTWKACSKSCGGGIQSRMRTCSKPIPRYGGKRCLGKAYEEQGCQTQPCPLPPVDGNWAVWSPWKPCTKTCAGGVQQRTRTCTNPVPQHGGRRCTGNNFQERRCNTGACPKRPIDGNWSFWSQWRACSKWCGGGTTQRTRSCTNPRPENGGRNCYGVRYQTKKCNTRPCRVDGKWSLWSQWKACSKPCGSGTQQRVRSCTNPRPAYGGRWCRGSRSETRICNTQSCRIDGKWSLWSQWKACSKPCGSGTQQRVRSCTNPRPAYGGRWCRGSRSETRICNTQSCRIDGKWSVWSQWKACSKPCGSGTQQRVRSCTNPRPAYGGRWCRGSRSETRICNTQSCRIDGKWSVWSQWKACSKSCGSGTQQRVRSCTNPRPAYGGRWCRGSHFETRICNTQSCRIDGGWRLWSSWRACSSKCGGGLQLRTRSCTNPRPANGGRNCIGKTLEKRPCNTRPCKIDGRWSLWSQWKTCNRICGGGIQQRMRSCTNPRPANGGRNCYGRNYQTRQCNTHPCKTDGKWSLWSTWRACSKSCGSGFQQRMRTCTNPRPTNGGKNCIGRTYETRMCNTAPCRFVGWQDWSAWGACSVSCGGGTQVRRRTCVGRCAGRTTETQRCNTLQCRIECGGTVTGRSGRIRSPGYPNDYPNNIECTWIIKAPENLQVKLVFSYFHMENGESCLNDYVEVRDGKQDSLALGKYCGAVTPEITWSAGTDMWVRFHSNGRNTYRGFDATWSAVNTETGGSTSAGNIHVLNRMYDSGLTPKDSCGGRIESNYGRLTSPGFPSHYRPNLDCEWVVTASTGRVIKFYFEYMNIDSTGHCGRDFVSLKDGDTRSSPSLGRYCGQRRQVTKTTSSNSFTIRFRSDGSIQRTGFSLRWTSYYRYRAFNPARRDLKARKSMIRANTGEVTYKYSDHDCPHGWASYNINDNLYCYKLKKHYHSWLKAYVKCRQYGAELLTITSSEEQEFVRYQVQKKNYVWIGLSDFRQEGNWTWENGTPLTYTNWARGEPNNGQRYWNEHCALLKPNGKWNDFPCDFQFSYICKMRKT